MPRSGVILGEAIMGVKGTNGSSVEDVARDARTAEPVENVWLTSKDGSAASTLCEETAEGMMEAAALCS